MKTSLKNLINKDKIQKIKLLFKDVMGIEKSLVISIDQVDDLLNNNIWVDASDVEGLLHICEDEMYLKPKLDTYKAVINGSTTAYITCDVYSSKGEKYESAKSMLTQNTISDAREVGYSEMTEEELVKFLFTNINQEAVFTKKI